MVQKRKERERKRTVEALEQMRSELHALGGQRPINFTDSSLDDLVASLQRVCIASGSCVMCMVAIRKKGRHRIVDGHNDSDAILMLMLLCIDVSRARTNRASARSWRWPACPTEWSRP